VKAQTAAQRREQLDMEIPEHERMSAPRRRSGTAGVTTQTFSGGARGAPGLKRAMIVAA
jgi:hypothetical protein